MTTRPRPVVDRLGRVANDWRFAYGSILVLQLRVMRGLSPGRDLNMGDTAWYFRDARRAVAHFGFRFAWSPLYSLLYGLANSVVGNVYRTQLLHRAVIAVTVTLLVLALMRRLLPPAAAWFVAAWWAVVPTNFDALYEVHLFAVIPPLVAALVAARWPNRRGLSISLAIVAISTAVVRPEGVVALAIGAAAIGAWELARARAGSAPPTGSTWRAYAVPLVVAGLLAGVFAARQAPGEPAVGAQLREREALTFCQTYAFDWKEHHADWNHDPWSDCQGLMRQQFGSSQPSAIDALRRSPARLASFARSNVALVPSALQLAVFNSVGGRRNPDYRTVRLNSRPADVAGLLLLVLTAGGLVVAWRERRRWSQWWRPRRWPLVLLASYVGGGAVVMVSVRPRPEYFFVFTVALMGLVVFAVAAILERLNAIRFVSALLVPVAVAAIALAPSPYRHTPRPALDAYNRLVPYRAAFRQHGLISTALGPMCHYIAPNERGCHDRWGSDFDTFRADAREAGSLSRALAMRDVRILYDDGVLSSDPAFAAFFTSPDDGWRRIASGQLAAGDEWVLLRR
jgi:hypothetical protein